MAKEKLKLEYLKVQSFLTTLEAEQLENVVGGYVTKGRRYTVNSRWTSVDTRVDNVDHVGGRPLGTTGG